MLLNSGIKVDAQSSLGSYDKKRNTMNLILEDKSRVKKTKNLLQKLSTDEHYEPKIFHTTKEKRIPNLRYYSPYF